MPTELGIEGQKGEKKSLPGKQLKQTHGGLGQCDRQGHGTAGLEVREQHVYQAKEPGPAGDESHWQVSLGTA